MRRNNKKDPLPEEFKTFEELSNFWDSHDVTDYAEYLTPVECNVASHPTHEYIIVLSDELNRLMQEAQSREGVSIETLVNLWVKDGLQRSHSR
ncbi:BrnA antitoxin family protein [bacterium]|nr:BrnA antitoxin family protein [bacterium]MBU1600201.1 BrnA antitoxin family protein [bacterium]MBU2462310.1 BrnA antitoxin family protein [bacterium]